MRSTHTAAQFGNQLALFAAKLERNRQKVLGRATSIAYQSITKGSPITGAPGQPVETGALLRSWVIEFRGPNVSTITSDLPYAHIIENGIGPHGPLTLRSTVGGFHSLKQTAAAWQRVLRQAMREINGS